MTIQTPIVRFVDDFRLRLDITRQTEMGRLRSAIAEANNLDEDATALKASYKQLNALDLTKLTWPAEDATEEQAKAVLLPQWPSFMPAAPAYWSEGPGPVGEHVVIDLSQA